MVSPPRVQGKGSAGKVGLGSCLWPSECASVCLATSTHLVAPRGGRGVLAFRGTRELYNSFLEQQPWKGDLRPREDEPASRSHSKEEGQRWAFLSKGSGQTARTLDWLLHVGDTMCCLLPHLHQGGQLLQELFLRSLPSCPVRPELSC